jgi:DNA-binding NtrC family response regulator
MSAKPEGSTSTEMTDSGAFAFIEKPFSPERFLDLVTSAIRQNPRQRMIG